jgi:UDP-N-acetylmuramyl pentapeptide synthase
MVTVRTQVGTAWEAARRVRFEPVGTISSTDVQKAIEEVEADAAGSLQPLTTPTVVTATGNVAATTVMEQTNQVAAIARTLPLAATWAAINSKYGLPLSIFDISGTASTNNVTINFSGGETASGLTSLTINTDYGGYRFEPKSGGGWVIV